MQIWILDENNFFTGESKRVTKEELEKIANYTDVPMSIGYVKSKFENGKWIEGATEEEIQKWKEENQSNKTNNLEEIKANKIKETKGILAQWLLDNPLFSKIHNPDGEYYNVTENKQMQLTMTLMLEQMAISQGTTSKPTWNATGKVCEPWTLEELMKLSFVIKEYVKPRIAQQQHYEVQINSCETVEDVKNIKIDYNEVDNNLNDNNTETSNTNETEVTNDETDSDKPSETPSV